MSLADFQQRIRHTASECGLNRLTLNGIGIDVEALNRASNETLSPEGMRSIAKTTMQAMVVTGIVDGLLQSQGIDFMNGSLFDLAAAFASHAADALDGGSQAAEAALAAAEHGAAVIDAAGTGMDIADAAMGVATGGITILTSMAASYLVTRYVETKKDQRQEKLQRLTAELIRRQSFTALRHAVRSPGCAPKELAQPVLLLLKAGDAPIALV